MKVAPLSITCVGIVAIIHNAIVAGRYFSAARGGSVTGVQTSNVSIVPAWGIAVNFADHLRPDVLERPTLQVVNVKQRRASNLVAQCC